MVYLKGLERRVKVEAIQSSLLFGTCTLLGQQHRLDVGQNTTLGNSNASQELVQFLIIPDGKLQMPWDDARLLVVPGSVASQLQDLCSHDCCHVHWSTSSNPLSVVALPEQSMDPAHRKLKSCPAGARLGLSLDLAAFTASRHVCQRGCKKI